MKLKKALLVFLICQQVIASAGAKLYITTHEVKVRRGSGTKFDMYYKLKKGDTVEQMEVDGQWMKVVYHEKEGYVPAKSLKEIKEDDSIAEDKQAKDDEADPYAELDMLTMAKVIGGLALLAGIRALLELNKKRKKAAKAANTDLPSLKAKPSYWYVCKHCNQKMRGLSTPSRAYCLKAEDHEWINLGEIGDINFHCKNCNTTVLTAKTPRERDCPSGELHTWTNLGKIGTKHYYCKDCGVTIMTSQLPTELNCSHAEVHSWAQL